jgi:hypothetical protein
MTGMDFLLTSPFSPPFFPLFLSHSALLSSHLLPDCTHVLPSTARKKRRRKRREKASGFRPHSIPPSPLFTIPSFPYRCLAFSCPSLVLGFLCFLLSLLLVSSFLSLLFFHLLFLSASSSSLTQVREKRRGTQRRITASIPISSPHSLPPPFSRHFIHLAFLLSLPHSFFLSLP